MVRDLSCLVEALSTSIRLATLSFILSIPSCVLAGTSISLNSSTLSLVGTCLRLLLISLILRPRPEATGFDSEVPIHKVKALAARSHYVAAGFDSESYTR